MSHRPQHRRTTYGYGAFPFSYKISILILLVAAKKFESLSEGAARVLTVAYFDKDGNFFFNMRQQLTNSAPVPERSVL